MIDGKLAENYGPVFANGVAGGAYKLDLGSPIKIAEVKTWSFNEGGNRGAQKFILFGSDSAVDPGWERNKFTPISEVDTIGMPIEKFTGTKVLSSADKSIGTFRWLMWVVYPVTKEGENTSFQEFQVIRATGE